jgi:hypothetical protein
LSGGGRRPVCFSLPPCRVRGERSSLSRSGRGVFSFAERAPVVDPIPASPRLIAGLSSSAKAGPIGCTSGRCAFDFGVLRGFLGEFGFFAISRIWDESDAEKRAKAACIVQSAAVAPPFPRRWPGIAVRRMASLTLAYARPSTPLSATIRVSRGWRVKPGQISA